jgi:hypothetical protein
MENLEEMTKEELLVKFRSVRTALHIVQEEKTKLTKTIAKRFGTQGQRDDWPFMSDAAIFEMLLS